MTSIPGEPTTANWVCRYQLLHLEWLIYASSGYDKVAQPVQVVPMKVTGVQAVTDLAMTVRFRITLSFLNIILTHLFPRTVQWHVSLRRRTSYVSEMILASDSSASFPLEHLIRDSHVSRCC